MGAVTDLQHSRSFMGDRLFGWICALLFLEIFAFYAVLNYRLGTPQFVDLPDLQVLAERRKPAAVEVDRDWLREGEWSWPLGGKVFVLPHSLALEFQPGAPANMPPLIYNWWNQLLKVEEHAPRGGQEAAAFRVLDRSLERLSEKEIVERVTQALKDHGALWVRSRVRPKKASGEPILIGHHRTDAGAMFLLRFGNGTGEDASYIFVSPSAIDLVLAWPHPLQASCERLEGQWVRLTIQGPLGQPLEVKAATEIRLRSDGMIRPTDQPGIYDIRFGRGVKVEGQTLQVRHDYLMPPAKEGWVAVKVE